MKIEFDLSKNGIKALQQALKDYKADIKNKAQLFVERLADLGIETAVMTVGEYGSYITFSRNVEQTKDGISGVMYATSGTIRRRWQTNSGIKEADISPLLMAEFGSGNEAVDAIGAPTAQKALELGMGQGTFPDQTHAFEPYWSWKDLDGVWHESSGEMPTMPLFRAYLSMEADLIRIAQEVFKG